MITEQDEQTTVETPVSTLGDRMQSGGAGEAVAGSTHVPEYEEEDIDVPGEVLPNRTGEPDKLRLSATPDQMPALIAGLRKWRGMTQAQLGEAIGYPAPVIGNIEQGSRKLGLKTLGDLFTALGGELHIEFRQK